MSIEVQGVTKRFGSATVLQKVDVEVRAGELVALLGPSGCGKTTLLRIIAGLEVADEGVVKVFGEDTGGKDVGERRVGFMFQHYALFRHMTVFENVAFGLRVRPRRQRLSPAFIADKVNTLLRLVQLEQFAGRYPVHLSGGQQQRVALARALAVEPRVLLLDEPFGSLDAKVRRELRQWLRRLHDDLHVTSVFVTHDQEEALEVADRVVLMNAGRIEQVGSPREVYDHPRTPFAFDFLGSVNLFRGRLHDGRMRIGKLELEVPEHGGAASGPAVGYVRSHEIEVVRPDDTATGLAATVLHVRRFGPLVRIELEQLDSGELCEATMSADRFRTLDLESGETVIVRPRRLRVFTEEVTRGGSVSNC